MGFNTVAVILNDALGDIEADPHIGKKIASAAMAWPGHSYGFDADACCVRENGSRSVHIGAIRVISQDHADGEQVTIVHGNTGCRADDATGLSWRALDQMQRCLERHGYKVTKPKRKKPLPVRSSYGEGGR